MRRYEAVLFDAGETLLHPDPSFAGLVAILLERRGVDLDGVDPGRIEAALTSALGTLIDTGEPFSISPEHSRRFWGRLYDGVLADLGVPDPGGAVRDYLYAEFSKPQRYALFPDSMPALRELRAKGYRLGLVSNFEAWLEELLDRLQLAPLLEVVVISGKEGVEKPDARIFEVALDRMGVPPERAIYVGDNPRVDVEPALALGMGAALIDRRGRYPFLPALRSLGEITAVVR